MLAPHPRTRIALQHIISGVDAEQHAVMPGVISLPHGWGHALPGARLSVAAARPGVNLNDVLDESLRDPLSGNAVLGGVEVQVAALPS